MKGISSAKVTEAYIDYKAFHLELIFGQNYAGKYWLAIPNWGTSGVILDPSQEKYVSNNAETIARMLDDTNIADADFTRELGQLVAQELHDIEIIGEALYE